LFLFFGAPARAEFSTPARSAFLVDVQSGMAIVAKDADEPMPPSSMLKLMTLDIVFGALKSGELKMDEMLPVSANADYQNPIWKQASKICLSRGQKISVNDAVMGLIVLSGGDAAVVVAEKLAGGESAFAARMQARAREIGMTRSTFGNAHGLPDPNNLMTSRELAMLAQHIITAFPEYYPLFATKRFEFGHYDSEWCAQWGRTHTINYNKLLFIMPGSDGMKTGHTDGGGYGMVASSKIGGRRLIGVINGLRAKSHDDLAREMKKLLEYGYANTANRVFYNPGDAVVKIPVWYGRADTVTATVAQTFAVTLARGSVASPPSGGGVSAEGGRGGAPSNNIRIIARYNTPALAPIRAGDKLGEIVAEQDGQIVATAPLIAAERVGKVQLFARMWQNVKVIFGMK